jgi:hypothetical protein
MCHDRPRATTDKSKLICGFGVPLAVGPLFFIELKGGDVGMVEPAAAAAEAAFAAGEMEERLLTWISFDLELLVAMKARLPVRKELQLIAANYLLL